MNTLKRNLKKIKNLFFQVTNMSQRNTKDIDIIKEIAVNMLLVLTPIKLGKWIPVIVSLHSTVGDVISSQIESKIQETVNEFIRKVHQTIKNQYRRLHFSLLFEGILWGILIFVKKHFDLFSNEKIIMIFGSIVIMRLTIGITNALYKTNLLLRKADFFKYTKFVEYYKKNHNVKKSVKKDAYNFYQIYYKMLISHHVRLTHKVTSALKMSPSKDDIFKRLWTVLTQNMYDFFWKKITIFIVICLFYITIILFLRYYIKIYFF